MAVTPSTPKYPIYTANTQDTQYDIPGRTDIANASDYNAHDAEILAHQTALISNDSRLLALETAGLTGIRVYYVSDTPGGATTRKLTFTNGILTSED